MAAVEIDYRAAFNATPSAALLLTPDLVIADANPAYLRLTGRRLDHMVGRSVFDVFPDNPADPEASGVRNVRASLERVLATGERDSMALQRYDVEIPGRPGVFEERWWSPVNAPVLGPDGRVTLIVHRVVEVTDLIRAKGGPGADHRLREMEADLYARARELQEVNERLRQAHAREREVALALQEAMLPKPVAHPGAAVRYRPAASALNVCGDWYDLAELPRRRVAVAVGDVVGHGLRAAGVMGQLRSALSAAVLATDNPAAALEVVARYAASVEGAESSTVVKAIIDRPRRRILYSCAGHPPPALAHPDGRVEFLDQATDPPLGVLPAADGARSQAAAAFSDGATLALYTDGLIERRGEDIGAGLDRLAASLSRHRDLEPEPLADALLADLAAGESADDIALVVIRL